MSNQCILIGSSDILRRLSAEVNKNFPQETIVAFCVDQSEARAALAENHPNLVLFEISHLTDDNDLTWIRNFLLQIRERYKQSIQIACVVTSPKKFALAGDLLFKNKTNLEPSGLINNFLIRPPAGIPDSTKLTEQVIDLVSHLLKSTELGIIEKLPTLWDKNWVPTMCAPASREVWLQWLPRYASYTNENPMVIGPTGSGKTRLAKALHSLSGRSGPFISMTPRDFSSSELVQAELFGAVSGAYTGAIDKWGLVKQAEKGTLFIDELQSIDRDLQGKLITFIEDKSYRRVGEAVSQKADVRFVFASNRSLAELVEDGSLRDDFAYRLERLQIVLSPIRERKLDIAAAACFGLAKIIRERSQSNEANDKNRVVIPDVEIEGLTMDAYREIYSNSWPGNLRQLENALARLIELASFRDLSIIDGNCTADSIETLLGHTNKSASDVYEAAARSIISTSETSGFDSISHCIKTMSDNIRKGAIESSGGSTQKASELISESEKALEIFLASYEQ